MKRALAALGVALVIGGCDELTPNVPGVGSRSAAVELARKREMRRACGSQEAFERLKALTFAQARASAAVPAALDRLAGVTVVRMEEPVVTGRDDALGVTRCAGRLVFDLPPGAERAFSGARRLTADVDYTAQEAADGSGLVFRLNRAEPLARRLAAAVPAVPEAALASASPIVAPNSMPASKPSATPTPKPTPAGTPRPEPSPTALASKPSASEDRPIRRRARPEARPVERRADVRRKRERAVADARSARERVEKRTERQAMKRTPERSAAKRPAKPAAVKVAARSGPTRVAARSLKLRTPERAKVAARPSPVRLAARTAPAPRPVARRAPTPRVDRCDGAPTRVDRLLCVEPALARADRRADAELRAALAYADPDTRAELRASRNRFRRHRDRCGSAGCLAQAYADRVAEIRDIAKGGY